MKLGRSTLAGSLIGVLALASGLAFGQAAPAGKFTEWGWPQPYERVSPKSVEWLKSKGWWPIKTNFYGGVPLYGMGTHLVANRFAAIRGLEVVTQRFASGPAVNESLIAGNLQFAHIGNFPFFSLIDKNAPIRGIFLGPMQRISVMVRNDSPIKTIADLKGKTIGTAVGSGAYMALLFMLKHHGLDADRDVSIRNLPWPEQLNLPSGIDAVAPWDMGPTLMTHHMKNARELVDLTAYDVNYGMVIIRSEIIENAPDVVQALVDGLLESILWARLNMPQTIEIIRAVDATSASYPVDLVTRVTAEANTYLRPTWTYPHLDLVTQNFVATKWMKDTARLNRVLNMDDFRKNLATEFLDASYKKLGWAIPKQNPMLEGSQLKFGVYPYDYKRPFALTSPQPFPITKELTQPWYYGGKWYTP
jgi:ABC-type nitrate/sulfonate/bicarbonate transport system substrate-binding protein